MMETAKKIFARDLSKFLKLLLDKMTKINFIKITTAENEYIGDAYMSFRKVNGIVYMIVQSLTITKTIPSQSKILFGFVDQLENLKVLNVDFVLFSNDSYCKSINAKIEYSSNISLYIESGDQPIEPGTYKTNGYVTLITNPVII